MDRLRISCREARTPLAPTTCPLWGPTSPTAYAHLLVVGANSNVDVPDARMLDMVQDGDWTERKGRTQK